MVFTPFLFGLFDLLALAVFYMIKAGPMPKTREMQNPGKVPY